MLQALRSNPSRQANAQVRQIPAPIGGLNAKDALADMPESDALVLDNFFPEANYVTVRRGHESHATGMTGDVQTLMTYHAVNGTEILFAAANNKIWTVTSAGAASSAYSTSITVNKWQHVNFTPTSGVHIIAVNGTDSPLKYNAGSAWSVNSLTGSISSSSNLINVFSHKERLWFVEKNTLNLWYLASQAVSGTLTKLPLGGVFNKAGQILAGGTLSMDDAGDGMDDLFVVVTDNGEAAIYSGTNPASDFVLLGVYPIGDPVGNRCMFKIGGDLIVITTAGAESIRQIILSDRSQTDKRTITGKVHELFNASVRDHKTKFGWQGFVYPKGRYALINVPEVEGTKQRQYVQNLITGAWCRFTGQNANCWGLLNEELYFGGNGGVVFKADTGRDDNGSQIEAEMKTAFTPCGARGQNKFFKAIRPLLLNSGTASLTVGVNVDYDNLSPSGVLSADAGNVGIWGSGTWGNSKWGGRGLLIRRWLTVGKIGTVVAARLKLAAKGISVNVNGFDILYEKAKGTVF